MDTTTRICPACGARALGSTSDDVSVHLRGEEWIVSGFEHSRCDACGEEPMTLEQIDALHVCASSLARHAKGLLGANEIRALRERLCLTRRQLEEILGVGEKTVIRWEKGTVFQSATADRLMRLLGVSPGLAEALKSAEALIRCSVAPGSGPAFSTMQVDIPASTPAAAGADVLTWTAEVPLPNTHHRTGALRGLAPAA